MINVCKRIEIGRRLIASIKNKSKYPPSNPGSGKMLIKATAKLIIAKKSKNVIKPCSKACPDAIKVAIEPPKM